MGLFTYTIPYGIWDERHYINVNYYKNINNMHFLLQQNMRLPW